MPTNYFYFYRVYSLKQNSNGLISKQTHKTSNEEYSTRDLIASEVQVAVLAFPLKKHQPHTDKETEDIIFLQTSRVVPTLSAYIKQLSVTFSDCLYFLLSPRQVTFLLLKRNKYRDSSTLYTGPKRKGNRTMCYKRPAEDIHLSPPSFSFLYRQSRTNPDSHWCHQAYFTHSIFYIYFFSANQICCYKPRTNPAQKLRYKKFCTRKSQRIQSKLKRYIPSVFTKL